MNSPQAQAAVAEVSLSEPFRPAGRALVAAVTAVAATYLYFLIFAQFGFLQAVQAAGGTMLRPVMAVMGGCGLLGSVGAARWYREDRGRWFLRVGFGIGGLAAALTLAAAGAGMFLACAALTGAGTGMITVTLAAMLRREVGGGKLGVCLGLGTGLAYGLCNVPAVFNATAAGHAVTGLLACGVGALAVAGLAQRAPRDEAGGLDYRPAGVAGWVAVFFALVWLDSAAFYVIQHAPGLKGGTWGGELQLYLNGFVHVTAALLAGLWLDRRWVGATVLVAAGLLITACGLIGTGPGAQATGAFCYAAGVSFYSTALVYYPAYGGRAGWAAWVYAVAGWVGSALGIGMAENLGAVPGWFLAVAGLWIGGGFVVRLALGRPATRAALAIGFGLVALGGPARGLRAADPGEAGRRVYIAEGCIHCHSQYVRPGTADGEFFGPGRGVEELLAQRPPLLGNRRQGPDLLNVALRRTRAWNRAHLIAPRALWPGSRMPSYRHLFADGAEAGEALLDYLETLRPVPAKPVQ